MHVSNNRAAIESSTQAARTEWCERNGTRTAGNSRTLHTVPPKPYFKAPYKCLVQPQTPDNAHQAKHRTHVPGTCALTDCCTAADGSWMIQVESLLTADILFPCEPPVIKGGIAADQNSCR